MQLQKDIAVLNEVIKGIEPVQKQMKEFVENLNKEIKQKLPLFAMHVTAEITAGGKLEITLTGITDEVKKAVSYGLGATNDGVLKIDSEHLPSYSKSFWKGFKTAIGFGLWN